MTPEKIHARAKLLAIFTIGYNLVEGMASIWLGAADETLASEPISPLH